MTSSVKSPCGLETGVSLAVPGCACGGDEHRWSAPVSETVEAVMLTRWRCTCSHCQCDALYLAIDPAESGRPQHKG